MEPRQLKGENMETRLDHKALELCWEIEKLPPSKQQTELSVAASELYTLLAIYCKENHE